MRWPTDLTVQDLISTRGGNLFKRILNFTAHNVSLSPSHRPGIDKTLLKRAYKNTSPIIIFDALVILCQLLCINVLTIHLSDNRAFPLDLTACVCSRTEINHFAVECKSLGIEYIGLCCGNASNLLRIVAEVYEKNPLASKYSPDMSKHYIFGENSKSGEYYTSQYKQLITSKVGQK